VLRQRRVNDESLSNNVPFSIEKSDRLSRGESLSLGCDTKTRIGVKRHQGDYPERQLLVNAKIELSQA